MYLRAEKIDSDPPETMRYPAPGFYYVRKGVGWEIKEWDGQHWWQTGDEIPCSSGQVVIARVPNLPV